MVADMPEQPLLAQRYRILTEVGRGGMGTVWHAHDEALGRDVAVKEVILPHGFSDEEREIQYKRTFREARTAARLSHPGVVAVYDVVEEEGRPWIVMELVRARSLEELIKADGPMSPTRAAVIGRQMLSALHAAHGAGILHRDVKPSNVLVTDGDRAVLTDFGIAISQGDATLTQTGLLLGSPAYISPERAKGQKAVSASDLWSLGATLYAAVEGKSPFERPDAMASLVAVLTDEADPAPHAGALRPVIEGLLRKDPEQRMTSQEAAPLFDRAISTVAERTQAIRLSGDSSDEPDIPVTGQMAAPSGADTTKLDVDVPAADRSGERLPRPLLVGVTVVLAVVVIALLVMHY
jgi:serine/threonine protein kinase